MFFDVVQELFELGAFGDGLGGVAGFNEFFGDGGFELASATDGGFALGGNGVAVLIDVYGGVHLAGGGDTEVNDGFGGVGDVGG